MTNEERVKYIEDRLDQYCVSNGSMNDRSVMGAFAYAIRREAINEMNSQFKEYLEKKRKKYTTGLSIALQKNATQEAVVNDKIQCLLNEIINELFKED